MDKIIIKRTGEEFITQFAAPSILTGRFVALVVGSNVGTVERVFSDPGEMTVHNLDDQYADKTYTGYKGIHSMEERSDGILIKLNKGA